MPLGRQLRIWGALAAAFALLLWSLGDVLLPFVVGAALAYFLDPLVDRLQALGLGRATATVTISLAMLLVVVLGALLVVPVLVGQTRALIAALPGLTEALSSTFLEYFPTLGDAESTLRQSLRTLGEAVRARSGELANLVLGSARNVVSVVLLVVVVPVVTFYLLLDWDRMLTRLDTLLPRDHAPLIRQLAREIDRTVSSFVRGMGTVCLLMGLFYALGLMAVGLQFGLLIGAFAGLVTFIPYVGALVGGGLALALALVQFWGDWVSLGLVAAVFVAGQAIEGNVLTPKLVGKSVGLHPVWLILALAVFGALFGFVGMLVAVPVAAVIGVLARHAAGAYLMSDLYTGADGRPRDTDERKAP